jgi:ATP-dependent Clp protease ATP-binding subunit ClpA
MFERFDHRARTVLVVAQEEVRRLNDPEIDVEHVLLGLASVDPDLVGVHVVRLRDAVAAARGTAAEPQRGQTGQMVPFTAEAKRALDRAVEGEGTIRPAELLLALLDDPDVEAALADARVDLPALRERAEASAWEPTTASLEDRIRGGDAVPVVLGGGLPIGDLGNARTDACLLRAILTRDGKIAALLRRHGIDDDALSDYERG